MVEYKTIALDKLICKTNKKLNEVINPVAFAIKKEAVGGWEFVAVTQIPVFVKPGCVSSALGGQGFYEYPMMVIFKREN